MLTDYMQLKCSLVQNHTITNSEIGDTEKVDTNETLYELAKL